jgi:hypothetical protein
VPVADLIAVAVAMNGDRQVGYLPRNVF